MSRRVVVITGASSGIGEATAERLSREPDLALVLVARREDRLKALATRTGKGTTYVAVDLTDADAPATVARHLYAHHGGRCDVLINNAGAGWRGTFADKGYANVHQHMELNFDAQVRLVEELLPRLRQAAPGSAIVNVASTAGRVGRGGSGAYSASKFALAGWSDALWAEEKPHGVHVGLVLPGFIATEGFPQQELRDKVATRWAVSTPEKAAEAIVDCALNGKAERYVPRAYALVAAARAVTPGLVRKVLGGGDGQLVTPSTKPGETSPDS